MKKVLLIVLIVVAGFATNVNAQTLKFGHIDISQLIQVMPERQQAIDAMEKEQSDLEDLLTSMNSEYNKMIEDYVAKQDSMSELVRQAKEEDINIKRQRLETFRQQAGQQLQAKEQELMKPIFDKADSTITAVAKEQGLIYVFDVSSRVVLYQSNQSIDILPLVKKKMGIE